MKQLAHALAHAPALALALALLGCGGGTPAPASPAEPAGPAGGCAQEIALKCARGVDGCIGDKTTEHVCVPPEAVPGPPCEQELALVCPEGQVDACLRTPRVAANHLCVYAE